MTLDSRTSEARTATYEAADRLIAAARTSTPCPPVRDLIGPDDVIAAYAVQRRVTASRLLTGARVIGRKIGLTSAAVQAQLGVDQPDFGMLFHDMAYDDGARIPYGAVLQARAEAEIAFVLSSDLDAADLGPEEVRGAIGHAVAALEICGSRIQDWDISFGDTVADNASSGAFVVGDVRKTLAELQPRDVEMTMTVDGLAVSSGVGSACMGDPLEAVLWLARRARELGDPLRAGQVILSGALGPMVPVVAGTEVVATISGLGTVSCTFAKEEK